MKLKEYPESLYQIARLKWRAGAIAKKLDRLGRQKIPVIVSLTSIPSRLEVLPTTIRSLLVQSVRPEKIVLWLHHDLEAKIPKALSRLAGEDFEIRFADLTCSHRKLAHSLSAFPGKTIVTCDDDLIYRSGWLDALFRCHQNYPSVVIGHECRLITFDNQNAVLPYSQWRFQNLPGFEAKKLLAIGFGGVLYPPGILDERVTEESLYLKLAPKADDLWFKAMSLLAGTATRKCDYTIKKPIPIPGSQTFSLNRTNIKQDGNRQQWLALTEYFDLNLD